MRKRCFRGTFYHFLEKLGIFTKKRITQFSPKISIEFLFPFQKLCKIPQNFKTKLTQKK